MEHSNHKSHVADVTTADADAIQHEEHYSAQRTLTGMEVSKILVHRFHFVYFYSLCRVRLRADPHGA